MRTGKRGLVALGVSVVCAVTVLAVPGTAFADPGPSPTRAASPSPSAAPTAPAATDGELEAVRARLDRLYRQAAVAADEYNAAEEKAEKQSAELSALTEKIADGQRELAELRQRAGAAARAQYRAGGLPDEARLMLSENPGQFLDGTGRVLQGQRAAKGLLARLARTQQDLKTYAADASAQWTRLEANRKAKAAARKRTEQRIAAAEKLESALEKEEKERLAALERQAAEEAQSAWLDTGVLDKAAGRATERGAKAVAYATAQIGKPYVWGAEGPKSFDCSGLTSQAWAAAGRGIPRTSQEQWRQLPHIGTGELRPGDLIIYFEDASHVGMYVGDGRIVHAPRPGRTVTLAGAGTMPILGVVRPDA
ncbi:C40 family peptidase [Streptomyces fumanus]|uniref:Glycoside hydrolase n=1 Tax=Streptomyces fumanus TaxID=67302 RepID=A0A919AF03_9ACTN|nr:C40 family peptidase [Streptomyces fumanus]GHF02993.1 glycoside hydrolase [Streptomyces fumanus]